MKIGAWQSTACVLVVAAAAAGWVSYWEPGGSEQVEIVIVRPDGPGFGPEAPVRVGAELASGEPLTGKAWHCRWVLAHTDVGLSLMSPNGCLAEVYIDAERTRLVRFEYDKWMSLNVVVERDGARAGFASSQLKYVE